MLFNNIMLIVLNKQYNIKFNENPNWSRLFLKSYSQYGTIVYNAIVYPLKVKREITS